MTDFLPKKAQKRPKRVETAPKRPQNGVEKIKKMAFLRPKTPKIHVKPLFGRSKSVERHLSAVQNWIFLVDFDCPSQNTSCVFFHPSDTQKADFLTLPVDLLWNKSVTSVREAFWKVLHLVIKISVGHHLPSVACILSGRRSGSRIWGQRHRHSHFPVPKKSTTKKKNPKKSLFSALFYVHKYVTSGRNAFWKASKSVRDMFVFHPMMSVACILSGIWCGIRMWGQRRHRSRLPTSKNQQSLCLAFSGYSGVKGVGLFFRRGGKKEETVCLGTQKLNQNTKKKVQVNQ